MLLEVNFSKNTNMSRKKVALQRFFYTPQPLPSSINDSYDNIDDHWGDDYYDGEDDDNESEQARQQRRYLLGVKGALVRRLRKEAAAAANSKGGGADGKRKGDELDQLTPAELGEYEEQIGERLETLQSYKHKLFVLMKQVV